MDKEKARYRLMAQPPQSIEFDKKWIDYVFVVVSCVLHHCYLYWCNIELFIAIILSLLSKYASMCSGGSSSVRAEKNMQQMIL